MKQFTFRKAEHLCSRKAIEALFGQPHAAERAWPLLAVFRPVDRPAGAPVQLLLSVSKRRFRHAVSRNRAKRLMREAYRRHKRLLPWQPPAGRGLDVAFVWIAPELAPQARVDAAVVRLLEGIGRQLAADPSGAADVQNPLP